MKLDKLLYGAFGLFVVASGIISCTDDVTFGNASLEKPSGAEATIDTVFGNAEYTRQFVAGVYVDQYYGLPYVNNSNLMHCTNPYAGKCDALTDCWQMGWNGAAVYGQYYTGTLTANVLRSDGLDGPLFSFDKEHVWEAIRSGWIFLENVNRTPEMGAEEKARLSAEIRCLIAARFFDAFQRFGGLPIMDHALTTDEITASFKRNTVDECVNFMIGLLNNAINEPYFPWVTSDPTTMSGRWTKAGAMALKCKILQFAASPLLNPEDGQPYYKGVSADVLPYIMYTDKSKYEERWTNYLKACEDFFTQLQSNGYYELTTTTAAKPTVNDYRVAYRKGYYLRESKEILHSVRHHGYDPYSAGRYSWHKWYTTDVPRNLYWPTHEYASKFGWSNGDPFNYQTAYNFLYDGGTIEEPGTMKMTTAGTPNYGARGLNSMFTRGDESQLTQMLINVTYTRDPRLYEECIVNSQQKNIDWTTAARAGDIWELWEGGSDALNGISTQSGMFGTGYGFNKYYLGDGSGSSGDNIRYQTQWVYLSLNEMYLNYAEALIHAGRYQEAVKQIDVVRSRVGLRSLSYVFSTNTTSAPNPKGYVSKTYDAAGSALYKTINGVRITELMEELLDERARELGLQDIRWFDMIRYKRTDWMTTPLHALEMHRLGQNAKGEWVEKDAQWTKVDKINDKTSKQPKYYTYKVVPIKTNRRVQWGQNPESNEILKWLLSPIPQAEINKGYGLVQNPGW